MSTSSKVFFAGRYSYRKTSLLVASCCLIAFTSYCLVRVLANIDRESLSLKGIGALMFFAGINGLLGLVGAWLLWKWFQKTSLALEISPEGINYGGRQHEWSTIQWIGGQAQKDRVELAFKLKGSDPDKPLLVDEPLTVQQYDALIQELSFALRERHPHVRVG